MVMSRKGLCKYGQAAKKLVRLRFAERIYSHPDLHYRIPPYYYESILKFQILTILQSVTFAAHFFITHER